MTTSFKCFGCKWLFRDPSVGYEECMRLDDLTDAEYDEFIDRGFLEECGAFTEGGTDADIPIED